MRSALEILNEMEKDGLTILSFTVNTIEEVKLEKKKIIFHQKKLRLAKKEVNNIQKLIRIEYSQKNVGAGSGGSTVLSLFGKKKLAGSWRAAAKADLRLEKESILEPYSSLKDIIDDLLQKLDGAKIQCDEFILKNRNI